MNLTEQQQLLLRLVAAHPDHDTRSLATLADEEERERSGNRWLSNYYTYDSTNACLRRLEARGLVRRDQRVENGNRRAFWFPA